MVIIHNLIQLGKKINNINMCLWKKASFYKIWLGLDKRFSHSDKVEIFCQKHIVLPPHATGDVSLTSCLFLVVLVMVGVVCQFEMYEISLNNCQIFKFLIKSCLMNLISVLVLGVSLTLSICNCHLNVLFKIQLNNEHFKRRKCFKFFMKYFHIGYIIRSGTCSRKYYCSNKPRQCCFDT